MSTTGRRRLMPTFAFTLLVGLLCAAELHAQADPQQAGTGGDPDTGMERVLRATEGLPPASRDEVMAAYHHMAGDYSIRNFQDPACMTLRFWEWRRENPGDPPQLSMLRITHRDSWYEWLAACGDRERIVEAHTARAELFMRGPMTRTWTEDQRERVITCAGETMADRYLENPLSRTRQLTALFTRIFTECRRAHGG